MKYIDVTIARIGEWAARLNIVLIAVIVLDVLLRYLFANTKNWVLELEWHLFSLIFLFGASYALQKDEHVRVDLFYQKYKPKTKAWVNLIGHSVFLIPWTLVVIKTSYKYAANSFSYGEGSPNPGGLPYWYIIKFCMVLAFVLLLLQGVSQIWKQLRIILNRGIWN